MTDNQATEQHTQNNAAIELGEKLRKERERKKHSIGEVAERLKLSARQIEGLESGNYEDMPELVFVRGFLRTYGRFLGIDDEEMSSYLDRIVPQNRSNVYAVDRNGGSSFNYQQTEVKKSFPKWIFGVLVLVLIGGGVYIWQSKSNLEYAKQNDSTPSAQLENASNADLQAGNISVVAMSSDAVASAILNPDSTQNASGAASAVAQTASAPAEGSAPVAGELVVKVRYRSKLVIRDKDEQLVINEIVPAGSEHRFQGGAPYNVWIGYALGATANYGGQEVAVRKNMVGKTTSSFIVGQ
ncbi:RodZ domain-containing protein [Neisseria montereyensis]|uniref:DUF4115 domain-containing protein n=1 Tax=Neisseria montereyensis TaxID=2973938 RepID=A0ABT2FCJ4_9NEIS|nr:RodZ domain-containing protein [Neisseria montereyensis]MCS4533459.1 DUF4115 domain-containing protein [Neisseria montereyensis]